MIKMNYDEILARIQENSEHSKADLDIMVEKKLKQLSGLISREGAAHIVANQLGIKLVEKTSGKLQIKNILAGMRDVELVAKVLRIYPTRRFTSNGRKGQVASLLVGDETGTIRMSLWNEKTEEFLNLIPSNDSKGILQDVHWSGGAFGYFPTYTLGNLYAAQFYNDALKKGIINLILS